MFGKTDNAAVRQLSEALRRAEAAEQRAALNQRIADGLSDQVAELEARLEAVYQRTPAALTEQAKRHLDMERLLVLAGLREDDPTWKTVLSYADEHERNEQQAVMTPGLSDGDRQYNAGRLASASDFASALRDLRVKAVLQTRKEKNK